MLGPTVVKKSQRKVVDLGEGGSRHWDDERDCEGGVPHSTKVSVVRTIGDTVEHDDVAPTKRPLVSRDPLLNLALAHKSTRSREETLAMRGNKDFCACSLPLREPMYESSPGWWVWGPLLEGSTVFTLLRRGANDVDEPYTRRFCPTCSVVIFDLLLGLGLEAGPHLKVINPSARRRR